MKKPGVLVVDNDGESLAAIERMLSHFKLDVDCILGIAAAFENLKNKTYRTLITGLDMSEMDGFELTRRVREEHPDMNVVLFAGRSGSHIRSVALDAKVSEVYFKQCDLRYMLSSIVNTESGKTFLLE